MMMLLARGLTAAVRSALVVRGEAFDALLLVPPPARRSATNDLTVHRAAHAATGVAFVALRVLQRLPGWRNTCLYRAVAECLVLRGFGLPATVRLGVARASAGAITAHAWVDCPGHRCRTTDGAEADTFAPLRRAMPGAVAPAGLPGTSA